MNPFNTKGQVVITGAAGGMGLVTSQFLAQKGYSMIAVDHNKQRLQKLQHANPNIKTIAIDLKDPQLITTVQETMDGRPILVLSLSLLA